MLRKAHRSSKCSVSILPAWKPFRGVSCVPPSEGKCARAATLEAPLPASSHGSSVQPATSLVARDSASSGFAAASGVSFGTLGLHADVCRAAEAAGFAQPAATQVRCQSARIARAICASVPAHAAVSAVWKRLPCIWRALFSLRPHSCAFSPWVAHCSHLWSRTCNAVQPTLHHASSVLQAQAVPEVLAGRDIALAAETGSGKTLAYLLPIIDSLRRRKADLHSNRPDAPECAFRASPACALQGVAQTQDGRGHWFNIGCL